MLNQLATKQASESQRGRTSALLTPLVLISCLLMILSVGVPVNATPQFKSSFSFVYPVMTPRRTSGFGMRIHPIRRFSKEHNGVDLAAPIGSPIRAVAGGTVVFADPYAGFGNLVVIKHNERVTTHYGHCDELKVKPGQKVKAGDIIATVGSTGMSTGPHLHFELRFDAKPVNPENYFPDLAGEAAG